MSIRFICETLFQTRAKCATIPFWRGDDEVSGMTSTSLQLPKRLASHQESSVPRAPQGSESLRLSLTAMSRVQSRAPSVVTVCSATRKPDAWLARAWISSAAAMLNQAPRQARFGSTQVHHALLPGLRVRPAAAISSCGLYRPDVMTGTERCSE